MKEERLWSASRSMRTTCRVSTGCEQQQHFLDLIDLYLTYIYIIPVAINNNSTTLLSNIYG